MSMERRAAVWTPWKREDDAGQGTHRVLNLQQEATRSLIMAFVEQTANFSLMLVC